MKRIYVLFCILLFALSAFSQTTPWSTSPPVTPQTRSFSGAKQIRWLWGSSSLYSLDDSLAKYKLKADSILNSGYVTHGYFNSHGVYTGSNGITLTGNDFKLGGSFTSPIFLSGGSNSFIVNAGTGALLYGSLGGDYSAVVSDVNGAELSTSKSGTLSIVRVDKDGEILLSGGASGEGAKYAGGVITSRLIANPNAIPNMYILDSVAIAKADSVTLNSIDTSAFIHNKTYPDYESKSISLRSGNVVTSGPDGNAGGFASVGQTESAGIFPNQMIIGNGDLDGSHSRFWLNTTPTDVTITAPTTGIVNFLNTDVKSNQTPGYPTSFIRLQDLTNTFTGNSDKTNQYVYAGLKKAGLDDVNNYELSTTQYRGDTLYVAGNFMPTRSEQVAGGTVRLKHTFDGGKTWSAWTTIYTPVGGSTIDNPGISFIGSRLVLLLRTFVVGADPFTTGSMVNMYSDDFGSTWTTNTPIVSPNSIQVFPYSKIQRAGDGKYKTLLWNVNYAEAWSTDGATWTYGGVAYDYRSTPIIGSVLYEPSYTYIGGNKAVVVSRNDASAGSKPFQFVSSDNMNSTLIFRGITNMGVNLDTTRRNHNPTAIYSDTVKRVLITATSSRSFYTGATVLYPDSTMIYVSDADAVFASSKAYTIKNKIPRLIPNGQVLYFKGYNSVAPTKTGYLFNFTETFIDWSSSTNFSTKVNNSYQYSLVNTTTPFDVKSINNIYPGSSPEKNVTTGNYDYKVLFRNLQLDNTGNINARDVGNHVVVSDYAKSLDQPIFNVISHNSTFSNRYSKIFQVFGNHAVFNTGIRVNATDTSAMKQVLPTLVNGDNPGLRISGPGGQTTFVGINASGTTPVYGFLKQTSTLPIAVGTTSTPTAIYVINGGQVGIGGGVTTPTAWLHLRAGTATASTAPLKFSTGVTQQTALEQGAVNWDGTSLHIASTASPIDQTFAYLNSPTFTGTPTLPTGTIGVTQTAGNSTTALATTAFTTTADNLKANSASPTFTGVVTIGTPGSSLVITEGTNGRVGQTVLVAGTKAITISGLTTSSRAFVQLVTPGNTSLTTSYQAVCTSNTLTIQANVAAGTLNIADTSTLNYFILN